MLNDVDLPALPAGGAKAASAAPVTKKAAAAPSNSGGVDLDAILDEAATANNLNGPKLDVVEAGPKVTRILSEEVRPWLAASANVPKDFREKWTKMTKTDTDAEICTKFQPSYAYRSWDGPAPAKNGLNRCLQEMVRKASLLSGIDEAKAARLLTLVNPVTDSENGKQLQTAFARQMLLDQRAAVQADANYSAAQFPALAQVLA